MFKRQLPFISILASLSLLSGYMLSKITLVGRTGISIFYKEYQFLKDWWKGTSLVFIFLLLAYLLQGRAHKKLPATASKVVQVVCLVAAGVGLYFTYIDFRDTLSHRLLGERFHLGAYLFWIGWMLVSLFYLVQPKRYFVQPEQNTP